MVFPTFALRIVRVLRAGTVLLLCGSPGVGGFRTVRPYRHLQARVRTTAEPWQFSSADSTFSQCCPALAPLTPLVQDRIRPSSSSLSTVLRQSDQSHPLVLRLRHPVVNPYEFLRQNIVHNKVDWWAVRQKQRESILAQSKMALATARFLLRNFYWLSPLILCVVPLFSGCLLGTPCVTPAWWKMEQLDYIVRSPEAPWVLSVYLSSNMVYFGAGWYLWNRLPPLRQYRSKLPSTKQPTELGSSPRTGNIAQSNVRTSSSTATPFGLFLADWRPTRFSGLALYMWASGMVSTTFHSIQAMAGHHAHMTALAEAWCYADHGVAISAALYFWYVCGRPTSVVWALGGLGVLALAIPFRPGYAWLHSLWHVLSAAAAVLWALQNHQQQRHSNNNHNNNAKVTTSANTSASNIDIGDLVIGERRVCNRKARGSSY